MSRLRWVLVGLFAAYLYSWSVVAAPHPPAAPNSGAVILTVSSPFELRPQALGLTLLLQNELEKRGLQPVDSERLEQALHEEQAWRPDRVVLTSAIPGLSNRLGATAFIQGRLEADGPRWRLVLRSYDVVGGYNMEAKEVSAKAGDTDWLVAKSVETLDTWLDIPAMNTASRWQTTEHEADLLAAIRTAQIPYDEKTQQRLLELLASTPEADRYASGLKAMWRRHMPENGGPLAQALTADLDGRYAAAIAFYQGFRPQDTAHSWAMIRAALLAHQSFQAMQANEFLRLAAVPLASAIRAQWFLNDGKTNEAEAALSALPPDAARAEPYVALGATLTDASHVARQARAYERAAAAAYAQGQHGLAAHAAYELAKLAPSRLVPDWIDTSYYPRRQRVETAEALSSRKDAPALLLANLLNTGNTAAAAANFYERAVRVLPFQAAAFAQAGTYFASQPNEAGKAELYLKVALALAPTQTDALKSEIRLLTTSGRCADAQALVEAWSAHASEPRRSRFLADVALQCQQPAVAQPLLERHLREAPEDAEALRLMVRTQSALQHQIEAELYYAKLLAVDKAMALELGEPKRPAALAVTAPKRQAGTGAPDADSYGELQSLQDELHDKVATGQSAEVRVDLAALADASQNLSPEEWQRLSEKLGLKSNAATAREQLMRLYAKNPGARSLVPRGAGTGLLKALRDLASRAESARNEREQALSRHDTAFLAAHPLLVALLALLAAIALAFALLYLYRHVCCKGAVSVNVLYNRSYHAGFFVARLSNQEREIGFRTVTRYWKHSRGATLAKLQALEQFLFPWQAIATDGILNFRYIPAGDYVLNIASIQIDPQTLLPIGSIEVKTPLHINDGKQTASVRLDDEMAYVGVIVENRLRSYLPGSQSDEVTVYVAGDREARAAGHLNEEIGFHLPRGRYTILAFSGSRRFSQPLSINDDFRSQWVRFRLEDT